MKNLKSFNNEIIKISMQSLCFILLLFFSYVSYSQSKCEDSMSVVESSEQEFSVEQKESQSFQEPYSLENTYLHEHIKKSIGGWMNQSFKKAFYWAQQSALQGYEEAQSALDRLMKQ